MSVFVEDSNDELPPLADSSRGSTEDFPRSNRPHIIISEIEDSDLEITPNSPEPVQATPLNGKSKANTKTAKPAGSSARDSDLDDIIDDDDPYRFTEHSTSSSSTQQRKRPCVTYASTAAKRSRIDTMRSRTAATTPTKQRESSSNLSNQRQKSTDPIWGFVMDNEIKSPEDITESHIRRVYGLTRHSSKPYCPNIRIAETDRTDPDTLLDDSLPPMELKNSSKPKKRGKQSAECTAARCRTNPNCLNHLGFAEWLRPDAFDRFALAQGGLDTDARAAVLSSSREMPAGLKNLAATCYLNSLLQVWFHNAEFRDCIYRYRPSGTGDNWCQEDADSDIVRHLQVIYAQMQYGLRKVVDPTGLVRALKIDSAVQQDAQEFGKLFTALLENLLEGQTDHQVRDVISSQFEGKLCYVTVCKNCKLASSREENFHELELNVSHLDFATVEDCLKAYLSEEVLDHSNQYYCSTCGSKQDAARRIRLKILPKVLNLQLLRFTFDLKTMTKKKKKGLVLFPAVLDASIFSEDSGGNESAGPALYELTAVLMHKGSTAYSGHFVARVAVDGSQGSQWYSFNDENVEVMDSVGFEFEDETKAVAKKLSNVTGHKAKLFIKSESVTESSLFASTCAYMLTYRRCSPRTSAAPIAPEAPPDIQGIVEVDNKAFMHEIETVQQRESQLENQFQQARSVRQAICSYWSVSSNQAECVYLPTSVLRRWMVGPLSVTTPSKMDSPALEVLASDTEDPLTPQECESSSDTQLVCSHGNLSFRSLGELKRVSKKAAHQLLGELGVSVEKVLTTRDLCGQCVKNEVALLLDHSRHEADVEFIKNCILEDTDVLYWVSKPWYIEWKKKRPQHSGLNENCSPAAEPYYSHVYCKHGSLSLDSTQRRLISETAYRYLKKRVFPGWETLMAVKDSREDDLECPTCRAEEAATVEATAGARSQAHAEKAPCDRESTRQFVERQTAESTFNLFPDGVAGLCFVSDGGASPNRHTERASRMRNA
ncbi:hypothetical protein DFJ73DRAFT_157681 [Zopfochytrium polystomum]|nr:hypothetical protein DFJ73DRAFT_157681 [Zopfochytrium polystomum]